MGTCFQSEREERQSPPRGERNRAATRIISTTANAANAAFSHRCCYRVNTHAHEDGTSAAMTCDDNTRHAKFASRLSGQFSINFASPFLRWRTTRVRSNEGRRNLACRHPYIGTLDCHSVIASCILCTLSLRRDETWLLECLVRCDASAGVDRISQRALIVGSLRSGFRDRLFYRFYVPASGS